MSSNMSGRDTGAKQPSEDTSNSASSDGDGSAIREALRGASAFQALHVAQVQTQLLDLYQKVACEKGRIEILGDCGLCDCVLISKDELDSIERALDMLSSQDQVKAMRDALIRFAGSVAGPGSGAVAEIEA